MPEVAGAGEHHGDAGIVGGLRVAEQLELGSRQAVIVTILCDSGEKYLSERFWTEG